MSWPVRMKMMALPTGPVYVAPLLVLLGARKVDPTKSLCLSRSGPEGKPVLWPFARKPGQKGPDTPKLQKVKVHKGFCGVDVKSGRLQDGRDKITEHRERRACTVHSQKNLRNSSEGCVPCRSLKQRKIYKLQPAATRFKEEQKDAWYDRNQTRWALRQRENIKSNPEPQSSSDSLEYVTKDIHRMLQPRTPSCTTGTKPLRCMSSLSHHPLKDTSLREHLHGCRSVLWNMADLPFAGIPASNSAKEGTGLRGLYIS
ncbi:uncharacterized protein PADG_12450 [Paracoccidioides brasiliensis Pb18]|uniref:Uncharacterized protein n=1 Tax=Paracoccidioides brasiliensis (strain Pb18) TaxID=502780 RepID=A0A0A0HTX8_PARBD|nr:uncharacterized protein PADG_12450 [Paracoccidioides brasiliensis Pb18]KGM91466.1 hypothetical protein PADG_12450 [Paracoccidioides brasiliensis Pb18]